MVEIRSENADMSSDKQLRKNCRRKSKVFFVKINFKE